MTKSSNLGQRRASSPVSRAFGRLRKSFGRCGCAGVQNERLLDASDLRFNPYTSEMDEEPRSPVMRRDSRVARQSLLN